MKNQRPSKFRRLTLRLKRDNELKSTWLGNLFRVLMTGSVINE